LPSDKVTGTGLLAIGIIGIIIYFYLLVFIDAILILQITALVGVGAIFAIIAWIGYTMATTPPPEPLDVGEIPEPTDSNAESKPAESKPAESKPAESKPAESKPAESKPAESKTRKTQRRKKTK